MGHENIVHALTHHGASPNTTNVVSRSNTALGFYILGEKFTVYKGGFFLLKESCSVYIQRGETALHMAARAGQADVVQYLLKNGAKVETKSKVGAQCFISVAFLIKI